MPNSTKRVQYVIDQGIMCVVDTVAIIYSRYFIIILPCLYRDLRTQHSPSSVVADRQDAEQPYQHPLTLSITDDDGQPEYDYVDTQNDQQSLIRLTECPAYRSTAQQ